MRACLYFQVHQPFRIKKNYSVFDIGKNNDYFDEQLNASLLQKVASKSYIPANALLLKLLQKHEELKLSFSITGTALDQFMMFCPEVLHGFQALCDTGRVEFLNETYYHSLAFLFDRQEFDEQVEMHSRCIKKLFGQKPKVFRNTELIYNNSLAEHVKKMGFKAVLSEGAEKVLGWRSPNFVYASPSGISLLMKNYKLSDDIAFRFSDKKWSEYPLSSEKFANWVCNAGGDLVNLFLDYETFGEHQWAESGIFRFLEKLPKELIKNKVSFVTPSELISLPAKDVVDVPNFVSWADVERDLSAWMGNKMQQAALAKLYALKQHVPKESIGDWRMLSTSDHFYYMCTKWFADGDVHKYFNPYDSPYDCFISFMNAMNDLALRAKVSELGSKTTEQWVRV
ncbi:polysaccharide deacetylase family protein [Candidatus Woesearchaeota archaeon]|nr:polysaccharide deacetylase family protein [Candidatus Woesearchaeota archaeon]